VDRLAERQLERPAHAAGAVEKIVRVPAAQFTALPLFDDAITLGEASALLGVHHTLVPRMLREQKIVGRVAWNPRGKSTSRVWIVSRKSCLANVKEIKALEAAGKKPGRVRKRFRVK
jgi:hypothetical protein